MSDDELLKLMQQIDPQTKRVPPGVRAIANAVEMAERKRCASIAETPVSGEQDDITMEAKNRIAAEIRGA